MDSDDYVETSDVDEQSMHSIIPHTPPRKRIKLEHDSFIGPLQWNESLQRDVTLSSTPFSLKTEQRDVSPSAATFTPPRRVDHDEEMSVVPSTPQSSQDPLLLESQQREGSPALVNLPFRSLTISPRRPSPSSPRIISPRPFTSSPPITPTKSIYPTSDLEEGLFTPIADKVPVSSTPPVSILYRTSPFSPPSAHEKENQTPTSLPHSSGPRDDVATNPVPSGPLDPLPDIIIPPEEQQQRVYSFRQRKAEQLHPYKADALRYKMTMKGVPEAIVNKGLPPGTHRRDLTNRYEDDDPAYDGELEEAERERRRERRRQRALADAENANRPAGEQAYLDGILPPLSDDEDVSALVKESRAIDKRRKQEEREKKERERKEAEEIQRRHRTKRFPLRPEKTTDEQDEGTADAGSVDRSELPKSSSPLVDVDAVVRDYHTDHFADGDNDMQPWDDDYGFPQQDEPAPSSQPRRSPSIQSLSDTSAPDPLHGLRPEQRKAISRMMPTSMAVTMLKGGQRKPRPSTSTKPISDDEDGPLLPGQTRTRKAITSQLKEIKGDSESEVEISERSSSESPSPVLHQLRLDIVDPGFESDHMEVVARPRAKATRQPEVIEISDSEPPSESEDEASDVGMDDNDVIYHRSAPKMSRMRQERLIDYMLPRGSGRASRKQASRPPKPRLKKDGLDVVAGGARRYGKGSQPRLSFDGHSRSKKSSSSRPARTPHSSTAGHYSGSGARSDSDVELQLDSGDFADIPQFATGKKWSSRKEKKKLQREARKQHGIYVVQGNGTRIIGGNDRQVFRYIQINREDPGLHYALTPLPEKAKAADDWTKKFPPRKPLPSKKRRREERSGLGEPQELSPPVQDPQKVVSDLGIVRLPAARTFPPSTAIYNGLVYELIDVIKATKEPPKPQSMHLCDLDLHAEMDVNAFKAVIPVVFDGIFDIIVALPSVDDIDVEKNWRIVARSFPRYISWFLPKADLIRTTTWQCLETLIKNLGGLDADALGKSLLIACWFCVDVSARLHFPTSLHQELVVNKEAKVSDLPQDVLSRPVALLLGRLLEHGFTDIDKFLQSETPDAFDPNDVMATELWVSIVHLLGVYPALSSTHGRHRFWTELHFAINQRPTPENNFGGSEYLWRVIYSLCALSQYSANGITKTLPHLPACWELVVVALNTIRLTASDDDQSIDQESLQTRDRYISLVLSRCSHLRERWKWRMENGAIMLKDLQEIFRSRSFAKFHHESSDWPAFVEDQNWDLSVYDPKDTTFVQYLKLVYQAAQDENLANSRHTNAMTKILSVLIPSGTVTFTDTPINREIEKSKYINRMVAAGVIYRLDKRRLGNVSTRVRNYIKFEKTTYRGRKLVIEGLNHWASMLIQDGVELDILHDWVNDMVKTLSNELNSYPPALRTQLSTDRTPQGKEAQRNTVIVRQLLKSVGQMALDCAERRQYPHPKLLHGLSELWTCWLFTGTDLIRNAAGFTLTAFLNGRQAILPPPPRPTFSTNAFESESQEFEGLDDFDDMDFSDLPEFHDAESKVIDEKDSSLFETMRKCKPNCTRFLRKALDVSHFDSLKLQPRAWSEAYQRHCSDLDMWTTAWLGTRISELKTDTSKLTSSLNDPSLNLDHTKVDFWTRRVRLLIMFKILRYHPKAYLEHQDLCVGIAIDALVSHATDWEKDCLAFILSIGATQHPRLSGVDTIVPRPDVNVDYTFSTEDYLRVRLDILLFLLKKAKDFWSSPEGQEVDHVSPCMAILSTAKDNLLTLPEGTEQKQEYFRFCVELAVMFMTHIRDVLSGDRYKGWLLWGPFQEPEALALR